MNISVTIKVYFFVINLIFNLHIPAIAEKKHQNIYFIFTISYTMTNDNTGMCKSQQMTTVKNCWVRKCMILRHMATTCIIFLSVYTTTVLHCCFLHSTTDECHFTHAPNYVIIMFCSVSTLHSRNSALFFGIKISMIHISDVKEISVKIIWEWGSPMEV